MIKVRGRGEGKGREGREEGKGEGGKCVYMKRWGTAVRNLPGDNSLHTTMLGLFQLSVAKIYIGLFWSQYIIQLNGRKACYDHSW